MENLSLKGFSYKKLGRGRGFPSPQCDSDVNPRVAEWLSLMASRPNKVYVREWQIEDSLSLCLISKGGQMAQRFYRW